MFATQFAFYEKYDGLVIEAQGLGNLSTTQFDENTHENKNIFEILKKMINKGVVVVLAPQTINGRISLNVYSNQRDMRDIGVLGDGSDMTPETTFVKLAWLLSNYNKGETRKLITQNLRGEITERTLYEEVLTK